MNTWKDDDSIRHVREQVGDRLVSVEASVRLRDGRREQAGEAVARGNYPPFPPPLWDGAFGAFVTERKFDPPRRGQGHEILYASRWRYVW